MKYRILGKSNLRVSVVGLGTWQFGGEWGKVFTQSEVDAVIGAAADCGINFIDTAECYGDHLSESHIGACIKARGDRERWVIATKFGHRFDSHMQRSQLWSADEVREQLEGSLRALQTSYIDLYQFHSGTDKVFDNQALWSMLRSKVAAGTIRHLGISVSSGGDVLHQVKAATGVGASCIQVVYNRLDRRPEEAVFPECRKQKLGVPRVPLASGFLSGKYKPGATFGADDVRAGHNASDVRSKLMEVEKIAATEVPAGVPMSKWALAWCLRDPTVAAVIPGCKNVEQVKQNASAAYPIPDGA